MMKNFIRLICLCVTAGCLTVIIWRAYSEYMVNKIAEEAKLHYEQAMARKNPPPPPTYTPTPTLAPVWPAKPAAMATAAPTAAPSPEPKVIQPEFDELRAKYANDDIIGYLRIPGTSVDYPVTRGADNAYYLRNDIYKDASTAGWIFMDYENNVEKGDRNTVIYGHNMRKDIMFHSLRNYQSWDYFNEHRYIIFNTLYENHVWEVFAFYKAEVSFPYIQVIFPSEDAFYALANEMKSRSVYDTGVDIKRGDRVLTLSTCTNEAEDTRFVLNARCLSPEEIPDGFPDGKN